MGWTGGWNKELGGMGGVGIGGGVGWLECEWGVDWDGGVGIGGGVGWGSWNRGGRGMGE